MHWTSSKPEKPGFYWWRKSEKSRAIMAWIEKGFSDYCVYFHRTGGLMTSGGPILDVAGQWQGPIEPEE